MVSAHVWIQSYSRKTANQSGGQLVRYLKREGEFKPVDYVKREGVKHKDYTDYVAGDVQNLPAWANNDPQVFFTTARAHEFHNRYYAFQVEFSLPRELTHDQHMALRADFMEAVMPDLPALWVKHDKRLESGDMHPHIHILLSARKRWDSKQPERGGCEKDLLWSRWQAPEQLRQAFADVTNYHLEMAGAQERVDPRNLLRRDIYRKAIRHGVTERPTPEQLVKEQAQAVAAWEQRKAYKQLSDVTQIPREEFVLQVRQWTREYTREHQVPRVSLDEVQAWHERDHERRQQEISQLALQIKVLAIQLSKLGGQEERAGQGLRARLQQNNSYEKERGHSY
jgi:hypothetical protein